MQLHNGGDASRDFIYVEDICRGLMACALKGTPGDVYNIASGRETTIRNWAEQIIEMTGAKAKLELLPKRDWDTVAVLCRLMMHGPFMPSVTSSVTCVGPPRTVDVIGATVTFDRSAMELSRVRITTGRSLSGAWKR